MVVLTSVVSSGFDGNDCGCWSRVWGLVLVVMIVIVGPFQMKKPCVLGPTWHGQYSHFAFFIMFDEQFIILGTSGRGTF